MSDWRLGRAARRLAIAMVGLVAMAATAASSLAASDPQSTIQGFYSVLLGAMKSGAGARARFDQLAPAIRQNFDTSYMARMAVGPPWSSLSQGQKQEVSEALSRYIAATYADNFDTYSGQRFEVTGQQTTPYGTIVESRIIKADGEPVNINYLMRQNNSDWQIGDVYLTGAISQVATLRSQFSSVVANEGVAGLVTLLNRKAQTLTASPASSTGSAACLPARPTTAC